MAAVKVPHSTHLPRSKKTAGLHVTLGPGCAWGGLNPVGLGSAAISNNFSQYLGSEKPQIELAKWLSCIDFYPCGYFEGN